MKAQPWRVAAAAGIMLASFSSVFALFVIFLDARDVASRDLIEYWAAGHQLLRHANPYDPVAILHMERAVGLEAKEPRVSLSPPSVLFVTLPLAKLSPKQGLILWLFLLLTC